ncbi:MAG: hypothetical protein RLZZ44_1711 [Bacteroidota bacterium]|jgi:hypothetical protein
MDSILDSDKIYINKSTFDSYKRRWENQRDLLKSEIVDLFNERQRLRNLQNKFRVDFFKTNVKRDIAAITSGDVNVEDAMQEEETTNTGTPENVFLPTWDTATSQTPIEAIFKYINSHNNFDDAGINLSKNPTEEEIDNFRSTANKIKEITASLILKELDYKYLLHKINDKEIQFPGMPAMKPAPEGHYVSKRGLCIPWNTKQRENYMKFARNVSKKCYPIQTGLKYYSFYNKNNFYKKRPFYRKTYNNWGRRNYSYNNRYKSCCGR